MITLTSVVALGFILLAQSAAWAATIITPPLGRGGDDLVCLVLNAGALDDPDVTVEIRNNDNVVVGSDTFLLRAGEVDSIGTSSPSPSGSTFYCRVSRIGNARVSLCRFDATSGKPVQCETGK
jgi:hypothetical protein